MGKSKLRTSKGEQNKKASGSIRIIAGRHRGRKLPVLMAEGLRPTTDRVKETVFNWLMPYVQQSQCLDCFTGAGSLAFEALSRNAKQVTCIELDKNACQQLEQNKALLKADNIDIHQGDAIRFLASTPPEKMDLVFIDPPFRQGLVTQTVEQLQQGWLNDKALIYIEMESEGGSLALPPNWSLLKEKVAGQVSYRLYQLSEAL